MNSAWVILSSKHRRSHRHDTIPHPSRVRSTIDERRLLQFCRSVELCMTLYLPALSQIRSEFGSGGPCQTGPRLSGWLSESRSAIPSKGAALHSCDPGIHMRRCGGVRGGVRGAAAAAVGGRPPTAHAPAPSYNALRRPSGRSARNCAAAPPAGSNGARPESHRRRANEFVDLPPINQDRPTAY